MNTVKNTLTKDEMRQALVAAGNEKLAASSCLVHERRAYLAESANPNHIVISGCCDDYIYRTAIGLGFRVDDPVAGGAPTRLLSAALQVL